MSMLKLGLLAFFGGILFTLLLLQIYLICENRQWERLRRKREKEANK